MKITDEQERVLSTLTCERLSDSEVNPIETSGINMVSIRNWELWYFGIL